MEKDSRVYVAGHTGLVGSAIVRKLEAEGFTDILTATHDGLDLTLFTDVLSFFANLRPEYVFLAAAKVGGIMANSTRPAEFIRDNLNIQSNVIEAARAYRVKKLLFLGSSCIYPRLAPQPIKEEALLTGPLEPTNEAYAIAKIAGIKMLQAYRKQYGFNGICAMPCNLYGPNDDFDLETSHVIPALIRKFHEAKVSGAKTVTLWGTGTPRREFLHVDDLADACLFLMQNYASEEIINVGARGDFTIADLALVIRNAVGAHDVRIEYDSSKPDGTPRKKLDTSRMALFGWEQTRGLMNGIEETYKWFLENKA